MAESRSWIQRRPDVRRAGAGFWVRLALATVSAVLFLVTLAWHDWIEIVFRVDPDHGGGWLIPAIEIHCNAIIHDREAV
jgi:hypothetical protein